MKLLSLHQFVRKFYEAAYKGRCLLVGFNLPFDLSRLARGSSVARGRFAGGFSLALSSYVDESGTQRANQFRPRIGIKHIDGKRALKGFTAANACDRADLIPEGSQTGEPEEGYKFRGHFLDLRTLAFALTDRGYSLSSACEAFEVEHGKQQVFVYKHTEVLLSHAFFGRFDKPLAADRTPDLALFSTDYLLLDLAGLLDDGWTHTGHPTSCSRAERLTKPDAFIVRVVSRSNLHD